MLRYFTKTIGAVAIVLGLASASYAQDAAKDDIIRPLTKSGSAAFMFTLGGFGTFGLGQPTIGAVSANVGGTNTAVVIAGAGMKYFLSDDMALRVLVAFGTSTSGADSITPGKVTLMNFGIGAGIEYHFRPLYSTSPYVGAQIGYGMASQTNTTKVLASGNDQDTKVSGSTFGIAAIFGFDWFFTRGIAIGAEYALGFATNSSSITTPNVTGSGSTTTDQPSSSSIALGISGGASAHLTVYF